MRSNATTDVLAHNRLKLKDIAAYRNLVDGWDEDGAVAPAHQTIVAAFDINLLLTVAEQPIYHTSLGPVGEILLKRGYQLTYTTERVDIDTKNEIIRATSGEKSTLLCLDAPILPETVEYFKTNTTEKLICLERALDTTAKWNLKHYMGDNFFAF